MIGRPDPVIQYCVYFTQKRGNELRHYEDAFALDGVNHVKIEEVTQFVKQAGALDPQGRIWRCAVADGATQGGFSKYWAQMLVDHFIYHDNTGRNQPELVESFNDVEQWLKHLSRNWNNKTVEELLSTVPANSPRRSRMQQTLLLEGQAATLAMLEIDPINQKWSSAIIGDSLVFHYRGDEQGNGEILPNRPAANLTWDQLDTNPLLISSKERSQDDWIWRNSSFSKRDMFTEATFQIGDRFFLMTDALAKWFLRVIYASKESYKEALSDLLKKSTNAEFVNWIEQKRSLPNTDLNYINNDDVTFVCVQIMAQTDKRNTNIVHPIRPRGIPETTRNPVVPEPITSEHISTETHGDTEVQSTEKGNSEEQITSPHQEVTRKALNHPVDVSKHLTTTSNDVKSPQSTNLINKRTNMEVHTASRETNSIDSSFGSITPEFKEPIKENALAWFTKTIDIILQKQIKPENHEKFKHRIAKGLEEHIDILDELFVGNAFEYERLQYLYEFNDGHLTIKQLKSYIFLSTRLYETGEMLKTNPMTSNTKETLRSFSLEINQIDEEHKSEWYQNLRNKDRPRDIMEKRWRYLGFMKNPNKNLKKLIELLANS